VRHVPLEAEPVRVVESGGFEGVRVLKLDARPCFVREGVQMREMQLGGWRAARPAGTGATVLYKGPFRQVADDAGVVYPRGERVAVDAAGAERLRRVVPAEELVFLPGDGEATA
jgi:hypothetical protein